MTYRITSHAYARLPPRTVEQLQIELLSTYETILEDGVSRDYFKWMALNRLFCLALDRGDEPRRHV